MAHLGGNYFSFIYVDYGVDREKLLAELRAPGFCGYRVLCRRPVRKKELAPDGWFSGVTVVPAPDRNQGLDQRSLL